MLNSLLKRVCMHKTIMSKKRKSIKRLRLLSTYSNFPSVFYVIEGNETFPFNLSYIWQIIFFLQITVSHDI